MGSVRRGYEALNEVSRLVDTKTFDAILVYMDETKCEYIRIENSLEQAERDELIRRRAWLNQVRLDVATVMARGCVLW